MDEVQKLLVREITEKSGIEILFGGGSMFMEFGPVALGCGGAYRKGNASRPPLLFWAPEVDYKRATHVLLHELAHATGVHLGRPMTTQRFSTDYEREEVIAESAAQLLMDRFGLSTDYTREQTTNYIALYSKWLIQLDTEYVASQVSKTYEFMLKNWLYDFETKLAELKKAV